MQPCAHIVNKTKRINNRVGKHEQTLQTIATNRKIFYPFPASNDAHLHIYRSHFAGALPCFGTRHADKSNTNVSECTFYYSDVIFGFKVMCKLE